MIAHTPAAFASQPSHERRRAAGWLAAVMATLTLAACSGSSETPAAPAAPAPKTILFVGNSFTGTEGGLDTHVQALAGSMRQPRALTVRRGTEDGATLVGLRRNTAVMAAIRSGGHDVVVLQDDLPEYGGPSTDPFKAEVRAFDTEIRARGARTVLFMAWAYDRLNWISQDGIAAVHRSMATELNLSVAPVGQAFVASRTAQPTLQLMAADREHQSLHGMYLAACVVYATLFAESPEGATYRPAGLTADEATFLQRTAWTSVTAWNAGR